MAWVQSIVVWGLSGRKSVVKFELNRDLNVFFGLNGSGKTSLLRILHSALELDGSLLIHVPFQSARVAIYSEDKDKSFVLEMERPSDKKWNPSDDFSRFESIRDKIRYREMLRNHLNWHGRPQSEFEDLHGFRHQFLSVSRTYESSDPENPKERKHDFQIERKLERRWSSYFSNVQSEVRTLQETGLAAILREVLSGKKTEARSSDLTWEEGYYRTGSFLKRQNPEARPPNKRSFRERFERDSLLRKIVAQIQDVEEGIEMALSPSNRLFGLINKMFTGSKTLKFRPGDISVKTENDQEIGIRSLSSGEKQVLLILVEALSIGRGPLIIDEPELSLHVDWQRDLLPSILELNPGLQIIAATHSPEIMVGIPDNNIYAL